MRTLSSPLQRPATAVSPSPATPPPDSPVPPASRTPYLLHARLRHRTSLVTAETPVLAVCKPGAGLLGVVEGSQPPPREAVACKVSVLLDFNAIVRRHFTRHGQHLTMRGMRLLAELVVAGLKKASLVTADRSPSPPPPSPLTSSSPPPTSPSPPPQPPSLPPPPLLLVPASATDVESPEFAVTESAVDVAVSCVPLSPDGPWTLPYNSYAEAVKSPPLMTNGRSVDAFATWN
ncbi:verprolin-like [Homalodisca vitripennis]|uniref:verprolin-like n=1 Tax=Homalodisca vitripennis TaxID=197043 RepID=UPI001EECC970|nr:verprolin-like [Homalodisca vitripennis]